MLGALVLGSGYFVSSSVASRVTPLKSGAINQNPSVAVLSARRAPNTLSNNVRLGGLRRSLNSLQGRLPSNSCLTVDWLGETLIDRKSVV